MVQDYKLFIGGEFKASSTGETFEDLNPATLESLATIQVAGPEDVDRAVEAAEAGFRLWNEVPAAKRAEVLFRAARILQERKKELAVLMTEEMGKVLPETREMYRKPLISQIMPPGKEGGCLGRQRLPNSRKSSA